LQIAVAEIELDELEFRVVIDFALEPDIHRDGLSAGVRLSGTSSTTTSERAAATSDSKLTEMAV
jgi:hypothetical protein